MLSELRKGILGRNGAVDYRTGQFIRRIRHELTLEDVVLPLEDLEFIDKIGEGAFGVVYVGDYKGTQVAIKKLNIPLYLSGSSDDELTKFKEEAYTMSKIRHPNIVLCMGVALETMNSERRSESTTAQVKAALEDVGILGERAPSVTQQKILIVTEYLRKGGLDTLLYGPDEKRVADWNYDLILACALQIARGMLYLHSHGIIHRDLKSSNVVVDDRWVVKVTDFGMSRIIQGFGSNADFGPSANSLNNWIRDTSATDKTKSSGPRYEDSAPQGGHLTTRTGTPAWAAPELSDNSYGFPVDVFSFGIVMWELWARRLPFAQYSSRFDIEDAILRGERPKIEKNEDGEPCPPPYLYIMQQCWAPIPEDRPDFRAIVAGLEKAQEIWDERDAAVREIAEVMDKGPNNGSGLWSSGGSSSFSFSNSFARSTLSTSTVNRIDQHSEREMTTVSKRASFSSYTDSLSLSSQRRSLNLKPTEVSNFTRPHEVTNPMSDIESHGSMRRKSYGGPETRAGAPALNETNALSGSEVLAGENKPTETKRESGIAGCTKRESVTWAETATEEL